MKTTQSEGYIMSSCCGACGGPATEKNKQELEQDQATEKQEQQKKEQAKQAPQQSSCVGAI